MAHELQLHEVFQDQILINRVKEAVASASREQCLELAAFYHKSGIDYEIVARGVETPELADWMPSDRKAISIYQGEIQKLDTPTLKEEVVSMAMRSRRIYRMTQEALKKSIFGESMP